MKAYRNFVVHMDYDDKEQAHIIIKETETGDEIERTVAAQDFASLVRKVGDEFYMAFTDWLYMLSDDVEWEKEQEEEEQSND